MSCHKHGCACAHEHLKHCKQCGKVWCEDCGKEWDEHLNYQITWGDTGAPHTYIGKLWPPDVTWEYGTAAPSVDLAPKVTCKHE
jgi:hypothetical protein